MNYLCLFDAEIDQDKACLTADRAEYAKRIHAVEKGKEYAFVIPGQGRSRGTVLSVSDEVVFSFVGVEPLRSPVEITLVVGVCRPQTVRKIFQLSVPYGVSQIIFLASANSEKSYFDASPLQDKGLQDRLLLETIEQSGVPVYPEIVLEQRFKPFVEDTLSQALTDSIAFSGSIAAEQSLLPSLGDSQGPVYVVIGPEKGWTEYEHASLLAAGCQSVSLGPAQFRIEMATAGLLSRVQLAACDRLQ